MFIITLILLLPCLNLRHVFVQKMGDGSYILAVPKKIADSQQHLKRQLSKHLHIKQPDHQYINLKEYPSNSQKFILEESEDSNFKELKGFCVNGKQNLNLKENLQQFKKGPCSPVTVVPGILATSIVIQINCQVLKKYDGGKIFQNCGWDTCSFIGLNRPDEAYVLWVGLQLSLKVSAGLTKCFGDLFGLLYNVDVQTDDFGARYSGISGIKSTWFGNSQATFKNSKCGANAIRDLSGYVSILSIMGSQCALKDYGRLLDILENMGYVPGITMQPLPYDFRYGILASSTPKLIPQVINNLYKTTGKKVVIVAHSLGTLHTLSGLAFNVDSTTKQKMVRHYIPITPPWSGTISAMRNLLYGDASYFTKAFIDTGINKYGQMKFTTTAGSTYDLFLRNIFERYKDTPWLVDVKKRIKYQKQKSSSSKNSQSSNSDLQNGQQIPMQWFPSHDQLCFDPIFKKNAYCETGLIDFDEQPIFQIQNRKYYGTEQGIRSLIKDNLPEDLVQSAFSLWQQTKIPGKSLTEIPAPEVNTSVIFSTVYDTQTYYKYNQKPSPFNSSDNHFIEPSEIKNIPGDISVPSFSPMLFLAKWIYEGSNKNNTIEAIEYCGKYEGDKEHYKTVSCQCYQNPFKNPLDCTHPCIISDKFIIEFILNKLTNNKKGYSDENKTESINLTQTKLQQMRDNCFNLHPKSLLTLQKHNQ